MVDGGKARAAAAEFRLSDLRRRRVDQGAHARNSSAYYQGNDVARRGASYLRFCNPRGGRCRSEGILGGRREAISLRCAATRRTDPGERYIPHPGGYANAAELTAGAKAIAPFEITVGCYPEKHPDSPTMAADIEHLKRKIDAGATRAITQFFYDNTAYLRYLEAVRKAGVTIPIVPGVMPVTNFGGVRKMADICGATLPGRLVKLFSKSRYGPGNALADRCNGRCGAMS